MHRFGRGVPRDDREANAWWLKASESGFAPALESLGYSYANEEGVSKDEKAAVAWWRKAAEQDYAPAQYVLGRMYNLGHGVEADDKQAVSWYRKAAEQGHAEANTSLGISYNLGKGVSKDPKKAAEFFKRAAAKGDALAKKFLPDMVAAAEANRKLRARQSHVDEMKRKVEFKSYAAAGKLFSGTLRNQDEDFEGRMKYLGRQGTKSDISVEVMKVLQVLDKDSIMLVPPVILETATQHRYGNMDYVVYGTINRNFSGSRHFEEKRCYVFIAEKMGTKDYTTARGFAKTVPAFFIYALGTLDEGIEGTEGVHYQCR